MKGYKYLSRGMEDPYAKDTFYKLGNDHEVDESKLKTMYETGFHFWGTLGDAFHSDLGMDIYEVKASGKILNDYMDKVYCSSKIRIVKKLEKEELWRLIEEEDLIHSDDSFIRAAVARHGYGLDILINDENDYVRATVATQGYGLDKLINDDCWSVRVEVANKGYGLGVLINDEDWNVRAAVAQQKYGLDTLINDENCGVRYYAYLYGGGC